MLQQLQAPDQSQLGMEGLADARETDLKVVAVTRVVALNGQGTTLGRSVVRVDKLLSGYLAEMPDKQPLWNESRRDFSLSQQIKAEGKFLVHFRTIQFGGVFSRAAEANERFRIIFTRIFTQNRSLVE